MPADGAYEFGPFVLDVGQRVLLRDGGPLRLTPREIDVLVALVERHGEIVDKGRFFDQVWRGLSVEECNLSQHVAALRRLLHDDARVPTYIETVPRRGYRFVAPVVPVERPPSPPPPQPRPALLGAPAHDEVPPPPTPRTDLAAEAPLPAPPRAPGRRRAARVVPVAIAVLGAGIGSGWKLLHPRTREPSLAGRSVVVEPFVNLTGDAHDDRIAETLTAEVMSDLRAVQGLHVEDGSLPKAGRRVTEPDQVVESALLRAEGRMRVTAEIIDARTNRLEWAEVYDADPVSLLETADRIAQAVVERLAALGTSPGSAGSADRSAAVRECVLAREFLGSGTPHVVREALEHFTAAAERDRGYAPALAGMAQAYLLGAKERVLDPREALAGAEAAARRALEMDPRLAEAHAALGEIASARWDFDTAEVGYRRALTLDPSFATVHLRYSELLTVRDRHEQAIAEARMARDLAPASPAAAAGLAAAYYHSGEVDAAIEHALAALRHGPRFAAAYDVLGWANQAKGRDAEALSAFQEAVRLSGGSPTYVAALARAHARAGSRDEARRLLGELERSPRDRGGSPIDVAEVLAALGETAKALQQVERAVAEGSPWLQHVDSGLSLASLHDRDRFRALVARMRPPGGLDGSRVSAVPADTGEIPK